MFNYASIDCGAQVLAANPEAKVQVSWMYHKWMYMIVRTGKTY